MRVILVLTFLLGCAARLDAAPAGTRTAAFDSTATSMDSVTIVGLLSRVRNGACPIPGMATGGQPDSTTLAKLAAHGFKTVLDLRAPQEARGFDEVAAANALGLRYVAMPVTPETLADSTFDGFRSLLQTQGAESIFVHCASGNRVGAMLLPWLVLDRGWSVERATPLVDQVGLRSEELRARTLEYIKTHTRAAPARGD